MGSISKEEDENAAQIEIAILQSAMLILERWADDHDDPFWKKHNQDAANMILKSLDGD